MRSVVQLYPGPPLYRGAVAQLGERLVCNQEATGSIPVSSTKIALNADGTSYTQWTVCGIFLRDQFFWETDRLVEPYNWADHAESTWSADICSPWSGFCSGGTTIKVVN